MAAADFLVRVVLHWNDICTPARLLPFVGLADGSHVYRRRVRPPRWIVSPLFRHPWLGSGSYWIWFRNIWILVTGHLGSPSRSGCRIPLCDDRLDFAVRAIHRDAGWLSVVSMGNRVNFYSCRSPGCLVRQEPSTFGDRWRSSDRYAPLAGSRLDWFAVGRQPIFLGKPLPGDPQPRGR